jgi:hypothetical protein
MAVTIFYANSGTVPIFNFWELAQYATSFSEIVLSVTWAQLQASANALSRLDRDRWSDRPRGHRFRPAASGLWQRPDRRRLRRRLARRALAARAS